MSFYIKLWIIRSLPVTNVKTRVVMCYHLLFTRIHFRYVLYSLLPNLVVKKPDIVLIYVTNIVGSLTLFLFLFSKLLWIICVNVNV